MAQHSFDRQMGFAGIGRTEYSGHVLGDGHDGEEDLVCPSLGAQRAAGQARCSISAQVGKERIQSRTNKDRIADIGSFMICSGRQEVESIKVQLTPCSNLRDGPGSKSAWSWIR
jgi:hypothetical protein